MSPHDPAERGKEAAGARAAEAVLPGMTLGLGTGSTVDYFLAALGRRCRDGELPGVRGVPTSVRTEREASSQGIPLTTLEEAGSLDLTVDGADEVNPELDLIKGLGGALLREKMVAQATRRLVIIVDEGKLVHRLGTRGPLPVEVVPFSWKTHLPHIASLGAETVLKTRPDGEPYRTDNGNLVLHCHFPHGIEDPRALEGTLASRAGIVETGLFLGLAQEVLVGEEGAVRSVLRPGGDGP